MQHPFWMVIRLDITLNQVLHMPCAMLIVHYTLWTSQLGQLMGNKGTQMKIVRHMLCGFLASWGKYL
jgi:hypothetical protein